MALLFRNRDDRISDGTVGEFMLLGQDDQRHHSQRPDEVPCINNQPIAQELSQRHAPAGISHHNKVIPGEQLRPTDNHQNQTEAECYPGDDSRYPKRERTRGTGNRNRGKIRSQRNKRSGEDGQGKHRHEGQVCLLNADILGDTGHFGREERIVTGGRRSFGGHAPSIMQLRDHFWAVTQAAAISCFCSSPRLKL